MAKLGMDQFQRKLDRWAQKEEGEAREALRESAEIVKKHAQEEHLSGPRMAVGQGSLTNPTIDSKGRLRNSLKTRVKTGGTKVGASIIADHPLASILFRGGVQTARDAPFVFELDGRKVVAQQIRFPERPVLQAALATKKDEVLKILTKHVIEAYTKA